MRCKFYISYLNAFPADTSSKGVINAGWVRSESRKQRHLTTKKNLRETQIRDSNFLNFVIYGHEKGA